jgi:hypothetical protein
VAGVLERNRKRRPGTEAVRPEPNGVSWRYRLTAGKMTAPLTGAPANSFAGVSVVPECDPTRYIWPSPSPSPSAPARNSDPAANVPDATVVIAAAVPPLAVVEADADRVALPNT